MDAARAKITGLVHCFNEEHHLAACLESMAWCDEILVVDSFSTDRTVEIARAHPKVRLLQHTYHGAAAQKNWALQHITEGWVFLLDADERCTDRLREEVLRTVAEDPPHDAFRINRAVYFLGRRIRYSGMQRDYVARLFRAQKAWYDNRRVHSHLQVVGEIPALGSLMDHFMVELSIKTYADKMAKYAWWDAAQRWRDGKRAGLYQLTVRPGWRFVRTFLIQRGLLDGVPGLVFCLLQMYGSFLKGIFLWGWAINEARGLPLDLPSFDDDEQTWSGLEAVKEARRRQPGG